MGEFMKRRKGKKGCTEPTETKTILWLSQHKNAFLPNSGVKKIPIRVSQNGTGKKKK